MTYAQLLSAHIYPYIGKRRVAEIGRETIHRLLTVVLPEEGASQSTVVNVRTCLSAMMQMAWDHGYRADNPVKGIRLKHPPAGPIVVATVPQFQRVYAALPHQPAKVFARLGVSTGARYCELISFIPEDFDFGGCMLTVSKSTVWLIDQGVDLERVRHRLGHGDLTTTARYVKVLDEEDSTAADVISGLLKTAVQTAR